MFGFAIKSSDIVQLSVEGELVTVDQEVTLEGLLERTYRDQTYREFLASPDIPITASRLVDCSIFGSDDSTALSALPLCTPNDVLNKASVFGMASISVKTAMWDIIEGGNFSSIDSRRTLGFSLFATRNCQNDNSKIRSLANRILLFFN